MELEKRNCEGNHNSRKGTGIICASIRTYALLVINFS